MREPAANGSKQTVCEHADQKLKQCLILSSEAHHLAVGYRQAVR